MTRGLEIFTDLTERELSRASWAAADAAVTRLYVMGHETMQSGAGDKVRTRVSDAVEKELRALRREARAYFDEGIAYEDDED